MGGGSRLMQRSPGFWVLVSLLGSAVAWAQQPVWINEDGVPERPRARGLPPASPAPPAPTKRSDQALPAVPMPDLPGSEPGPGPTPLPKPEAKEVRAPAADSVSPDYEFALPPVGEEIDTYVEILTLWQKRRQATEGYEIAAAGQLIEEILARFRKMGGTGPLGSSMPGIGAELAREALQAEEQNNAALSVQLAETAVLFAPDVPETHLTLARVRFAINKLDLEGVFAALKGAWVAQTSEIGSLIELALDVIAVLIIALAAWLILTSLPLFLRSLPLLVHDVGHLMPAGVSRFQAYIFIGLLSLLPILLGIGPQMIALSWLLLCWGYLSWRERRVVLVVWGLCAAIPLLVGLGSALIGPRAAEARLIFRATHDLGKADARDRIAQLVERDPDDALALAALALIEKRHGRLDAAREAWNRAIARQPDAAWLHCNLGNALMLKGEAEAALAAYKRATELDPTLIHAHMNIANVFFKQRKNAQAQSAAAIAMGIDRKRFGQFQAVLDGARPGEHNLSILDIPIPTGVLVKRVLDGLGIGTAIADQVAKVLFLGLPTMFMFLVCLCALVLLIAYGIAIGRVRTAHACPRCGDPACTRCDDTPDPEVCAQCYHVFQGSSLNMDRSLKARKEDSIRRYRARRNVLRRLLSLIAAGTGHLLVGASIRGVLLVFVLSLLGSALVLRNGFAPSLFVVEASFPVVKTGLLVAGILALIGVSNFSASRLER